MTPAGSHLSTVPSPPGCVSEAVQCGGGVRCPTHRCRCSCSSSGPGETRWEKPQWQSELQRRAEGGDSPQAKEREGKKSLPGFIFVCILIVGLLTSGIVYVLPWKQQPWSPAQFAAICKGTIVGLFVQNHPGWCRTACGWPRGSHTEARQDALVTLNNGRYKSPQTGLPTSCLEKS